MAKNQNIRRGSTRSNNNNPEGRNQFSGGFIGMARERPAAAAAVAAGAAAAGVFLWSKRGQISDQLSQLSDQIGEWTDNFGSEPRELETVGGEAGFSGSTGTAPAGEFTQTPAGSTARSGRTGSVGGRRGTGGSSGSSGRTRA